MLIKMAESAIKCYTKGGKILVCGNGGSAADAQHIAAELSGRYLLDRTPLNAEALHVNSSYTTAVGNDYGFEEIYARAISAKGRAGDILLALSTSGSSINILKAIQSARQADMTVFGMTGSLGQKMVENCDFCLVIPSDFTPRIQEFHILAGHILCELIESELFGN